MWLLACYPCLSYLFNLVVCFGILFGSPTDSIIRSIYVWWSLLYLIGRTLLVSVTAASINDEARKPIEVLQLVPVEGYKVEVRVIKVFA